MTVVVDTNVAIVANGKSPQASSDCVNVCTGWITKLVSNTVSLAIDDQWFIIREYMQNLRSSGEPGLGDAFLKWVLTNQANPKRCTRVTITRIADENIHFKEFPKDPALVGFDPSDCKFVAVALIHPERLPILQAVDSKWWSYREVLKRHGLTVEFICEHDILRLQ